MKYIALFLIVFSAKACCTPAEAGSKTYYNRNGSVKFRSVETKHHIRTYDSKGTFSGEFRKQGNSVRQTNPGFRSAKPGSSFGK